MVLMPTPCPVTSVHVKVLFDLGLPGDVPTAPTWGHQQYKMANSSQGVQSRLKNEGCPIRQRPHSFQGHITPTARVGWGSTGLQGCALKWRDSSFIHL